MTTVFDTFPLLQLTNCKPTLGKLASHPIYSCHIPFLARQDAARAGIRLIVSLLHHVQAPLEPHFPRHVSKRAPISLL